MTCMDASEVSSQPVPLGGEGWSGPQLWRRSIPPVFEMRMGGSLRDKLVFCEEGSATLEVTAGGRPRIWNRSPGSIDVVPAGFDPQTVQCLGEATRVVCITLPELRLHVAPAEFGLIDEHIVDLCRRLIRQAELGQPYGSAYVDALTETLATYLEGRLGRRRENTEQRGPQAPRAPSLSQSARDRVHSYVQANLHRDVTIRELAEVTGYSIDHFGKLFKKTFGVPPYHFLLDCRVDAARHYLAQGVLPLADIALRCGFATQAHFTAIFKLRTGVTPGEFRRRLSQH
jgi:AraC family transcriptional regulator